MSKRRSLAACTALLLLVPSTGAAQLPLPAVEVAGAYYAFTGEDLDGLEPAPRIQVSLYGTTGLALVGVTGTWGRGGIEGFDESFEEVGLGLTLRRSFGAPGSLGAYAAVHAGWTRLSVELDPGVEENGFTVGLSGGPELDVGGVRVFLAGEVLWQTMGDVRLIEGAPIGTGGDQGWRLGGKLGILLGRVS